MLRGGRSKGIKGKRRGKRSAPQSSPPFQEEQEAQKGPSSKGSDSEARDEHVISGVASNVASSPLDTSPPIHNPKKKPKVMTDLTEEEEEDMAMWIKDNKCLYNKKLNAYKDAEKKTKLWEDKAAKLSRDTNILKVWYRSLRTRYSRLLKKSMDRAAHLTERDQWVLEKFSFLKVHVYEVKRRTAVSIKEKLAAETAADGSSGDEHDGVDKDEDSQEFPAATSASSTNTPITRLSIRPKKVTADEEQLVPETAAGGQQSMAIQEKMLDMMKPGRATERTTYADWTRKVMVDLHPSLWRKFQQEHSNFLHSYLNRNDELKSQSAAQLSDRQDQPPSMQYRPPNTPFRPPNMPFRPPNTPFRPPNTQFRPPNTQFRPPNTQFRPPNVQYRLPNVQYRPPNTQFRPPNMQYQPPNVQCQSPNTQCRPLNMQYQPPNMHYRPRNMQYQGSECQQYQGPSQQQYTSLFANYNMKQPSTIGMTNVQDVTTSASKSQPNECLDEELQQVLDSLNADTTRPKVH